MVTSLATVAVLHWAVLLIPGFNVVLIGRLAAGGSRRAALGAVVGMTTASFIWATLAVAGVGAVFAMHPQLRQATQLLGGAYLLYVAFQLLRAGASSAHEGGPVMSSGAALRAGFLTSALNPKIALFYGSVFATALPAEPAPWLIAAAVALVYANSWAWHGSLAFVLSHPGVQGAYLRNGRRLNRLSALLVGAFGARLIVAAVREAREA